MQCAKENKKTNSDLQKSLHRKLRSSHTNRTEKGGELRCSKRISNLCSKCGTRRVSIITNTVINHESGKEYIVITTKEIYHGHF